ncbi:MAG: hypothetical protein DCC51_09920, partial [Anaerolineae bacterium]
PVRCGEGLVDAFAALSALDGNLDAPALVAPEDGATLTTSQPEVSWAAVTGADMYRVVIAGDDSFATNVIDMTVDSTEFTPADPLPDGTYYWRVKALNVGEASPWSDDWSFTVEQVPQCETPGAPDLLAPEDGHTFDVADQPLAFSWSAAENADVYSLAIDTDPDLSDAPVVTVGGLEHTLDAPLDYRRWPRRVQAVPAGDGQVIPAALLSIAILNLQSLLPRPLQIVAGQMIAIHLAAVLVNLQRHDGDDHALQSGQAQVQNQRAVLVQHLGEQ